MSEIDLMSACYGTESELVKNSDAPLSVSAIKEIVFVVHFGTVEHYEYSIACERPEVDAVAEEWWEYQQRYVCYRRTENDADGRSGVLERVLTDGLCHWVDEGDADDNQRWPRLSLWNRKPGPATIDWACLDFDGGYHIVARDLTCDETERTDSYGDSGMNYFDFMTDEARAAAEEAGYDIDDADELRMEYSGDWFGQEPLNGLSGFGILFEDGSYILEASESSSDTHGNAMFRRAMARFVKSLVETEDEAQNLLRLLGHPELEYRKQGLSLLSSLA